MGRIAPDFSNLVSARLQRLGLSDELLLGVQSEGAWAASIKCHTIADAALSDLLSVFVDPALRNYVVSESWWKKLKMLTALGVSRQTIEIGRALGELRNTAAHSLKSVTEFDPSEAVFGSNGLLERAVSGLGEELRPEARADFEGLAPEALLVVALLLFLSGCEGMRVAFENWQADAHVSRLQSALDAQRKMEREALIDLLDGPDAITGSRADDSDG